MRMQAALIDFGGEGVENVNMNVFVGCNFSSFL